MMGLSNVGSLVCKVWLLYTNSKGVDSWGVAKSFQGDKQSWDNKGLMKKELGGEVKVAASGFVSCKGCSVRLYVRKKSSSPINVV